MVYTVRFFRDGKMIKSPDYPKLMISNKTVDRIVNEVFEREAGIENQRHMPADEAGFEGMMCL